MPLWHGLTWHGFTERTHIVARYVAMPVTKWPGWLVETISRWYERRGSAARGRWQGAGLYVFDYCDRTVRACAGWLKSGLAVSFAHFLARASSPSNAKSEATGEARRPVAWWRVGLAGMGAATGFMRQRQTMVSGAERSPDAPFSQWIAHFSGKAIDGGRADCARLGEKGAGLAELARLGLPVPPGFTLSVDFSHHYNECGGTLTDGQKQAILEAIARLEQATGTRLGDGERPLLLSVRPGAQIAMPGQMETVPGLGLNRTSLAGLVRQLGEQTGDLPAARLAAFRSWRKFVELFGHVVMDVAPGLLHETEHYFRAAHGLPTAALLTAEQEDWLVQELIAAIEADSGEAFPHAPEEQLFRTIEAVYAQWGAQRMGIFRRMHNLPEDCGIAISLQQMVFGNLGTASGAGLAFTRSPASGQAQICGTFWLDVQGGDPGEEFGGGVTAPAGQAAHHDGERGMPLRAEGGVQAATQQSFEHCFPAQFEQLRGWLDEIEQVFKDMQAVEFTMQAGKLYLLQAGPARRTLQATLRTAIDLAETGVISRRDALMRIKPESLEPLLHPTIDPDFSHQVIGHGVPAAPGAAIGEIQFDPVQAQIRAAQGQPVILVRDSTAAQDIQAMSVAAGVLTTRGGATSHAAVLARGMGRPCVAGVTNMRINAARKTVQIGHTLLRQGDFLTIDGSSGEVMAGQVKLRQPQVSGDFARLLRWADEVRHLHVHANAETPREIDSAISFGAEGLGLVRTEHMLLDSEGLRALRAMLLAPTSALRRKAADQVLVIQRAAFEALFEQLAGRPVVIRLLDPPLHEFLPRKAQDIAALAALLDWPEAGIRERIAALAESNPMLGHRGCRLGITMPELVELQARAILEAALAVDQAHGIQSVPQIMVPFVGVREELALIRRRIDQVAQGVTRAKGAVPRYRIGVMIEVPRAALRADRIAEYADFISYGTNDLTQMVYGASRDDGARFIGAYLARGIWQRDPFVTLDQAAVGELVASAVHRAREAQPELVQGICGEHGGDPASIEFFDQLGLDYISCSPFRVPIARLAAAQAAIRHEHGSQQDQAA